MCIPGVQIRVQALESAKYALSYIAGVLLVGMRLPLTPSYSHYGSTFRSECWNAVMVACVGIGRAVFATDSQGDFFRSYLLADSQNCG